MLPTSSTNIPSPEASKPPVRAAALLRFVRASRRYPWPPLLTTLLLAIVLLDLPIVPSSTEGAEVDLSLGDVLNFAHEHRLQFGPDITSTYGPLSWLYFPYFSPHSGASHLITDFLLTFATLAGLCLAAWRLNLFLRIVLLVVFTWATANVFFRGDLLVETGLLCWGLLCAVETGQRLALSIAAFAALAVYASLAKVSFLFIAGASVAMIACDLFLRGERKPAAGLLLGFSVAFLVVWIATGQSVMNLGLFMLHALATAQSYNQALGIEGLIVLRQYAFVVAIFLLLVLAIRCAAALEKQGRQAWWRRALLFLWLSFLNFTTWKHGFTRLDSFHAPLFLTFVLLLAVVSDVLCAKAGRARMGTNALALVCSFCTVVLLQMFFFLPMRFSVAQPFIAFRTHFLDILHPAAYESSLEKLRTAIHQEYQLPHFREIIGHSSVDVFGQYQSFALDNDLNYWPRPIFQSYNSCNRTLMAMNEQYYLAGHSPQFVLFDFKILDEKLPPLEDAWLLRHLLINYKPVSREKRFVLLQAQSTNRCQLTLLRESSVPFGKPIDLREFGPGPFWLELELAPTLRGRLRQFLYASPVVRTAAWSDAGKTLIIRRRAPPSMLAAGFLASPLLLRTLDIEKIFDDEGKNACYPAAYSVEAAPGQNSLWQGAIHFRVYRIENPIGTQSRDATQPLEKAQPPRE